MNRSIMPEVLLLMVLLSFNWAASAVDIAIEARSETESESISLDPTKVTSLSWHPRAFLYRTFLTIEECDHIISLAKNQLTKSRVDKSGESVESDKRTSSGMFLFPAQDEIVKRVEDRIAVWTFLPPENGEGMQVLRYEHGQKYEPHVDYFGNRRNQTRGGDRVATVLMYLSDVIKGGETVFPLVEDLNTFPDVSWTECGRRGGAVKPRKGDALLFYSLHPDGSFDKASLHQGCPVLEGEKWSATKWLHGSFYKSRSESYCVDNNEMCEEWAAYGECEKNPAYMVGSKSSPGSCRKSCKTC